MGRALSRSKKGLLKEMREEDYKGTALITFCNLWYTVRKNWKPIEVCRS